jgi:hypothetical protein
MADTGILVLAAAGRKLREVQGYDDVELVERLRGEDRVTQIDGWLRSFFLQPRAEQRAGTPRSDAPNGRNPESVALGGGPSATRVVSAIGYHDEASACATGCATAGAARACSGRTRSTGRTDVGLIVR